MLKKKLFTLCTTLLATSAFAGYSSNQQTVDVYQTHISDADRAGYTSHVSGGNNGGYNSHVSGGNNGGYSSHVSQPSVSGSYESSNGNYYWHHRYRSNDGSVTITVNRPTTAPSYAPVNPGYQYRNWNEQIPGLRWISLSAGERIPPFTVIGGSQPGYTLFVCRASYRGGVHPGKVIAGNCNIGWGGREIELRNYDVLVANRELGWVSANNGDVPANAIPGGYDKSGPLYICQADYKGGRHPGKLIGDACNIGYGHREIRIPYYYVLVG